MLFDRICRDNGIAHRLTQPACPTTTGKVERFHLTFRRECLDDAGPFESVLAAQAAIDTWVAGYNCDRPHQSLDMAYPADRFASSQQARQSSEALLPLRLPPSLELAPTPAPTPEPAPAPASAPAYPQPVRQDTETPEPALPYVGGPLEFDRVVPTSGNMSIRGKQFWLGHTAPG